MKLRFLILSGLVFLLQASCHNATPPPYHDGNSSDSGDSSTPGDNDDDPSDDDPSDDMAEELADDTPRYIGPQVTLDYGDGGVMFVERADAGYAFFDIDGNTRASIEPGSLQTDGRTLRGTRMSVNGNNIEVSSSMVLKASGNRRWIRIADVDGLIHLFVV